jgi:hypothetical protein
MSMETSFQTQYKLTQTLYSLFSRPFIRSTPYEKAYCLNPFRATFLKIGTSARLSRDRLPCDSPIEATTPF